ncbi:MAG: WHG domain-containing protein, partial [Propionibacterium sp.]|nr:WHG domain-containing protein [Propionibacterium sp.]
PAHFAVMFNPELLHDDPELDRASGRAFGELRDGVERLREGGQIDDAPAAVIAAWSLVHGLTTLALSGNLARAKLDGEPAGEPSLTGLARRAVAMLYGSAP